MIRKIAHNSDAAALGEFLAHRTVFVWNNGKGLRFVEYVELLRIKSTHRFGEEIADKTYAKTLERYLNLPQPHDSVDQTDGDDNGSKHCGPDCRKYFRAILDGISILDSDRIKAGSLMEEQIIGKAIQSFVRHNFHYCLRESLRKADPFTSRYDWRVGGGVITVYMPRSMNGRRRRQWLRQHAPDADPRHPGERERIQTLINRRLVRGRFVPYENHAHEIPQRQAADNQLWTRSANGGFARKLGEVVAEEKAATIDQQRPAIGALGPENLSRMIVIIFEALEQNRYDDGRIRKRFSLSASSYSRFAGSRWRRKMTGNRLDLDIPDLWKNTAGVLASNPIFREVIEETGFKPAIAGIVAASDQIRAREDDHES